MHFTVDGRRAYAYTGGQALDPQRPTVVFLHGALNDHCVWTLLARWCAHHGTSAVALDLPGHGLSDGPARLSIEALTDWLLAALDALDLDQVALVGHSMGSLLALETAGRAPERVARLVLVGTAYPMAVSQALIDTARQDPLEAIRLTTSWSIAHHASKPSYPGPGAWLHGGIQALSRQVLARAEARGWRGEDRESPGGQAENLFELDFDLCRRYAGGLQAAERVRCPTHLVLGSRDRMTQPRQAQALQEALARQVPTQRHVLDCGHALMQEQPEALLSVLQQILTGLPPAKTSIQPVAAAT